MRTIRALWKGLLNLLKQDWLLVLLVLTAISAVIWFWGEWIICDLGSEDGSVLRNLSLVIGTILAIIVGIPLAWWRAHTSWQQAEAALDQVEKSQEQVDTAQRQAETSASGLLNDRYQKGAEMLGSDTLATRLAGIYALEKVAREHPDEYHIQIMRLLCGFIRHPTLWKDKDLADGSSRSDVEAAVHAISRCRKQLLAQEQLKKIEGDYRPDLTGAYLANASLEGINLVRVRLIRANLTDAELKDSDITGADLQDACLLSTSLVSANLSGANLERANLSAANLAITNLSYAALNNVDATLAYFAGANGLTQDMLVSLKPSAPIPSLPDHLSWPFEEDDEGGWQLKPEFRSMG